MKKKIFIDIFINIFATSLPVLLLQIVIFPYLGRTFDPKTYGYLIAIYSLLGLVSGGVGSSLNNIKLIEFNNYNERKENSDFGRMLINGSLVNVVLIVSSVFLISKEITMLSVVIILIASSLMVINEYSTVEFRLKLNYKKILIDKVFLAFGYTVGLLAMFLLNSEYWQLIFLFGELFRTIFLFKNGVIKTSYNYSLSEIYYQTLKKWLYLIFATLLLRITNYADKLLILPLLGSETLAIYFAASIISKVFILAFTPLNNVILSYLSKHKKRQNDLFYTTLGLTLLLSVFGYGIIIFLNNLSLKILYPTFVDESLKYIYLTSAITLLHLIASVIQPFILRFSLMKYQIYMNMIDAILYLGLSYLLSINYGLTGFCYGIIISKIIKILLMFVVFLFGKTEVKVNE